MRHQDPSSRLYIVLISVHGLIRSQDLELGHDADTGGQISYVVDLARALAVRPDVERVDLLTRRVIDTKIDPSYQVPVERLSLGANIVRLDFGPRRYLRKEVLWPHLERFVDNALQYIRTVGRIPDIIHSHYADSGYAGARLAGLLGVPLVYSGHSLGRDKLKQLLKSGVKRDNIESQYNISQRIEAEEIALDTANLVIASTQQEVDQQYSQYDNYQPSRMVVIPPGIDLTRFHPPKRYNFEAKIHRELKRFLTEPRKPMIMALSRADERKNIAALVQAFGENNKLNEMANLLIVAGNRDDIQNMERGPRSVLTQLLMLIDRYDLYGKVAYPKHHDPSDVPHLYQFCTKTHGVFVNPALIEPFGLTLIEAAASGLPIVATEDGGPRDILSYCKNGVLVDPSDKLALANAILNVLSDPGRWYRWSKSGVRGAQRHFTWHGHAESYVRSVRKIIHQHYRRRLYPPGKSRLPTVDRIAISGIDNTLLGDEQSLQTLVNELRHADCSIGFGVATGRRLESVLRVFAALGIRVPDILITSMGSEIHYCHHGKRLVKDSHWKRHIDYRWDPEALRIAMAKLPGLKLQVKSEQRAHKISYQVNKTKMPTKLEIQRHLRRLDLHANVIYTQQAYIDLLPIRASKGQAIRYLAIKWGLPLERFLVAGDAGNDLDMLLGDTLAIVVGNHSDELARLKGKPRIYFAKGYYAQGVLEGLKYYDFLGGIRIPDETSEEELLISVG